MAYLAELDDRTYRIEVSDDPHEATATIDGQQRHMDARPLGSGTYSLLLDGRCYVVHVAADGDDYTVSVRGQVFRFRLVEERRYRAAKARGRDDAGGRRELRAMMPGKVIEVLVSAGAHVERDQGLLIIEAMKMQNEIRSPTAGAVREIAVTPGQTVKTGDLLVVIE
jgi:biotin carboxyl carrier protein